MPSLWPGARRHGHQFHRLSDNEAQRLTFDILSQKLDLFGKVLDASDNVLHEPRTNNPEMLVSVLSIEFESDLREYLQPGPHCRRGNARNCRTARQDFGTAGSL